MERSSDAIIVADTKNKKEEEYKEKFSIYHSGRWKVWDTDVDFRCGGSHDFLILSTPPERTAYALASLCGIISDGMDTSNPHNDGEVEKYYNEIVAAVKKLMPEITEFDLPEFEPSGMTGTSFGCGMENTTRYGVVMCENEGLLREFLLSEGITVEQFIAGSQYLVLTGDSNGYFEKLAGYGIIDKALIKRIFRIHDAVDADKDVSMPCGSFSGACGYRDADGNRPCDTCIKNNKGGGHEE